jgi:tetratricopeptide (TPR) repeat protein
MADSPGLEPYRQQAREHIKRGRLDDAIAALEEARRANEFDPEVHEELATVHYLQGSLERAAEHFERVTRLDPRRGASWINLGAVYNRLGKFQRAAEVLRRAVQIERKSSAGYFNLGYAYRKMQQWSMAVPAYREAIKLDPKMTDAYVNLGNVLVEMGNLAQAEVQFRKALELRPDHARARRGLEHCQQQLDASRTNESPFGRLVDVARLEAASAAKPEAARVLSDEERRADRRALHELLQTAGAELGELLASLNEQLEPRLKQMTRAFTHRTQPGEFVVSKSDSLEQFIESRRHLAPRLKASLRTFKQLADHEEHLW